MKNLLSDFLWQSALYYSYARITLLATLLYWRINAITGQRKSHFRKETTFSVHTYAARTPFGTMAPSLAVTRNQRDGGWRGNELDGSEAEAPHWKYNIIPSSLRQKGFREPPPHKYWFRSRESCEASRRIKMSRCYIHSSDADRTQKYSRPGGEGGKWGSLTQSVRRNGDKREMTGQLRTAGTFDETFSFLNSATNGWIVAVALRFAYSSHFWRSDPLS